MYIKTYKIPKTTMSGESPDPAFARQIYHVFVSDMRLEPDLLLVNNYDLTFATWMLNGSSIDLSSRLITSIGANVATIVI